MRTDDLIAALAADTHPVPRAVPQRRLAAAAAFGAPVALVLVLAWLKLRPDLGAAVAGSMFWMKAGYTAALGASAFWAAERLGRPGVSAGKAWTVLGLVAVVFIAAGLVQFAGLSGEARMPTLRGGSWTVCSVNILILGAPMTVAGLLALRSLAPTRPALAGFAVGVFSGGVAATVYGLHCPEATVVFVSLWYTLGIAACGLLGALAGRWALRW